MKKVLVGLCNNIQSNIDKIKTWSRSFKKHCDGDVVLLCTNSTEREIELCKALGIITTPILMDNPWYINHKRLLHTKEFVESSNYEYYLVTDVFDVVFQSNPFEKMEENYDVFVSGEGVNVNQEPWNSDNISKIFPNEILKCLNTEVINSGVILGKKTAIMQLMNEMYLLCESGLDSHNIKDQASLIVLVSNNKIPNLKIFNLDDGWAMHCAVSGPTQFFDGWGFRSKLKYGIPYMQDGKVYTRDGKLFDIVHQFNRIPEWDEILRKEYVK